VASVLTALKDKAAVGVNLLELDKLAANMIREAGAESCYVDYAPSFGSGPFGYSLCTSVNDAVLHGKPHSYVLKAGDVLSVDFAASLHGWVADSALSLVVGSPDGSANPEGQRVIEATEQALEAGISEARVGNKIGDISHAIGEVGRSLGFKINTQFGGHGVGHTMHEEPHIANDGKARRGYKLTPGMVFAIEPWFMAGTDKLRTGEDGWTLLSADGSVTAHSEHTVAITEDGPLILTARS
jgi:methionyl aminopeptidase